MKAVSEQNRVLQKHFLSFVLSEHRAGATALWSDRATAPLRCPLDNHTKGAGIDIETLHEPLGGVHRTLPLENAPAPLPTRKSGGSQGNQRLVRLTGNITS